MTDKGIAASSGLSPQALLKQAVTGGLQKTEQAGQTSTGKAGRRVEARTAAIAGAALTLGLVVGAGGAVLATSRGDPASESLSRIQAHLDTGQAETARLRGEIETIGKSLTQFEGTTASARTDAKTRSANLMDRVSRSEQALGAKITALGERQDQIDRDLSARIAALSSQLEKRVVPVASAPALPAPPAPKGNATEPSETGSLTDTKVKSSSSENWALREVYDGVAVIEDRKRQLIEVVPGNTVPGMGRVEAIERRGRAWIVVTRQGLITSQTW